MYNFSNEQIERYSRHIILKEVGGMGQTKLLESKVLLIGAGGLGSPAGAYLAAAGIGTLGIIDHDVVDLSNLQRQILHGVSDIGHPKTASAKSTIAEINPDVNVIVHPECTREVVDASDYNGSTEYIIDMVNNSDINTTWAVGTEINLVKRLAEKNPDKKIYCLDSMVCPCSTMYRIHPAYLLWILDGLNENIVVNEISVDDQTAKEARIALDRMLSVI